MPDETNVFRRIEWAIEAALWSAKTREAKSHIENMRWHSHGYVEPGVSDPESGAIVCGNWNKVTKYDKATKQFITVDTTPARLAAVLEKLGADLIWEDQWDDCHECGRLFLTSPDSHGWTPHYHIDDDGTRTCFDCLDAEEYLEGIEESDRAINQMFDPDDHGYVLVTNDFETGFHPGQDSDPRLIAKLLRDAGIRRWLFSLEGKGQFEIRYSLWMHEDAANEDDGDGLIIAKRTLERGKTDGPSNAGSLQASLEAASIQASELRKAGSESIIISHVSDAGSVTKEVSMEDFLAGKALD